VLIVRRNVQVADTSYVGGFCRTSRQWYKFPKRKAY